jgi:hypothetical protein
MSYSLARLQKMRAEAEKAEAEYNDPYDNDGFIYRKRPPVLSSCSLKALEEKERKYDEIARSLIKELDPNEEHITIKKAVRALDKHALGESEGQYELPDGRPVDSPFRFGARYVSRLVNPNALEDARSDLESEIAKSIKKKSKKPASKKRKRNIWGYGGKSRKAGRSARRMSKKVRRSRRVRKGGCPYGTCAWGQI